MILAEQNKADEVREDHLWGQRWQVVHHVWLSSLYHSKRERFFDFLDKASKATAAIGGAAAVSQLLTSVDAKIWIAAAVSIVSILSLVVGFSQKARKHGELTRDFTKLWAQIEEVGPYPGAEKLNKFKAQILALEASEPAAMHALVKRCENQIAMASGHPKNVVPLTFWERVLMHVWDFEPTPIKD